MGISVGQDMIQDGLVLALDASDKNSYPGSGTTWFDVNGNGGNMTLNNGPTFNSGNGGYIVFDGSDDYGQASTATLPTANSSPLTLEAFCLTTSTAISYQTVLGTAGSFSQIGFSTNRFAGGRNGGGGGILYTNLTTISANTWYHMVMTYDSTNGRFYLNGNLIYTGGIGSNGNNNGVSLLSTYNVNFAGEPLNGRIASARVYNRALSATEILQNYNAQKTRFGLK